MGDGHILKSDVEFGSSAGEVLADLLRDGLSLGDELGSIELGDDGLEDFVTDGGEDSLIVVDTEVLGRIRTRSFKTNNWRKAYLVDLGQSLDIWSVQHSQCQAHHLQILATSRRGNIPGLGPHIEDDALLQPRHQEVRALIDDILLDTRHSIENHSSGSAFDIEYGLAGEEDACRRWNRQAVHEIESPRSARHCIESTLCSALIRRKRWKGRGGKDNGFAYVQLRR